MWLFWTLCLCILTGTLAGKTYSPVLKDFPLGILQKHILQARHLPVCVVFRKQAGQGTYVEHTAKTIWKEGLRTKEDYSYWQLGSLVNTQASQIGLERPLPELRCYTSPQRYVEYGGRGSKKSLVAWMQTQALLYENGLPEASLSAVNNSTLHRRYTLLGFSSSLHHYTLEDLLAELHEELPSDIAVFFVHAHNADVRALSNISRVVGGSALVFLAQRKLHEDIKVAYTMTKVDITRHNVDVFMASKDVPALHMNEDNLGTLFEESRHYPPTLLCLYAWWAPDVLTHLRALQRTAEELTALKVTVRFALLEVSVQTQHAISRHLNTMVTAALPALLLLTTRWQHRTVVGIDQEAFSDHLPTPGAVVEFLQRQGVRLVTPSGEQVTYQPWGLADQSQMSLVSEGPAGYACYRTSHNQTNNTPTDRLPRPHTAVSKGNHTHTNTRKRAFLKDPIEEKMAVIGGVPMVTDALWYDAIERSHAPTQPSLYAGAEWRGEVTQISLVIFIMADCASCRRHMGLFSQLNEVLRAVDGGRVYLMNCTRDPAACGRHNVTGFPTLVAFRGLGWLRPGDACHAARRVLYHGALRLEQVVSWFGEMAAPAVTNLRFAEPDLENSGGDVWLVGTVLPRRSDYLHRARLAHRTLYSFKCFRFACEQLFAHASCYVVYSSDVPPSEFEGIVRADDLVITQVTLRRSDGLSAVVMRLGEPLLDTLEEEAGNSIHHLHGPHRYPLPAANQRCEHDAAACTDYVVAFTRDHARLAVNAVSMATFHAAESVLTGHSMPILIAFAHRDNLTAETKFYKTLTRVGRHLYRHVVTVTVDVDSFMHWANRFTPRDYANHVLSGAAPVLFRYPRFCLVRWRDHDHAAFYPAPGAAPPARYTARQLVGFAERFLSDPSALLVATEHF